MQNHVIHHHQVQKSVAIVVAKRRAGGPASIGYARLLRYICKSPVSIVVVQNVSAVASHVQIRPAVVVVIPHRSTHGKARRANSRLVGHISKRSIVIVVVSRAFGLLPFQRHRHGRCIREVDVQPPVSIVVKKNHATAHRFDHDLFLWIGRVLGHDAGLAGNVLKLRNRAPCALHGLCARPRRRRNRVTFLAKSQSAVQQQRENRPRPATRSFSLQSCFPHWHTGIFLCLAFWSNSACKTQHVALHSSRYR